MNTYIRAAASFCDKNTMVKVCRVCRVWSEPEPDGLGLGLPYRRRRKTMFVSFKNIHEGDKLSVFDGDSEFHYTADEDAAEERDALRKNDSNWSVNVTDDNGRTKKLFPSDFAPYIIYLSVVKKGDWRGSNLVFESVFNSSEDIIRGIRSIFERHVKDESCRRLSGAERISDMAKKYLTPEHTEQFGFRFIAEGMNFVRSDINDILPNDCLGVELTFYSYEHDEYSASPLFFAKLPHLGEHCKQPEGRTTVADILRKLDELYGDLPVETSRWALEYQLWARMLLAEGAVMLNPKYLDPSACEFLVSIDTLERTGDAAILRRIFNIPISEIKAAWEELSDDGAAPFSFVLK